MPKAVYQIVLGVLLLTFTVAACKSKGGKDKEEPKKETTAPKDSAAVEKPVDENNKPVPPPQ